MLNYGAAVDEELDVLNAHVAKMNTYGGPEFSRVKTPPLGYMGRHRKEGES